MQTPALFEWLELSALIKLHRSTEIRLLLIWIEEFMGGSLKLSQYPAKFGGHRHCGIGDNK